MAAMNTVSAARRGRRSLLTSERGAELVEFALVFPMLLLVMLGIMDFGFLFQRYEVLTAAAREGARIAILPGYTDADVQARVTAYLTAGGLTQPGDGVGWYAADGDPRQPVHQHSAGHRDLHVSVPVCRTDHGFLRGTRARLASAERDVGHAQRERRRVLFVAGRLTGLSSEVKETK